jgi:DNA ligase D-like protein (predicted 3'-phosphoesterase)
MTLREYDKKRDFARTGEPRGRSRTGRGTRHDPIFVIQHHAASSDHYDFRLEVDGVLVSWAVPKGPSVNPADKRLAVRTEDHPMEYADFEGVIPAGEYGGGTVMVWDTGTYRNTTVHRGEPRGAGEAVGAGHLTFELNGTKLHGEFALTRTGRGRRDRWLLVKRKDEAASTRRIPVRSATKSAITGRTMHQIGGRAP